MEMTVPVINTNTPGQLDFGLSAAEEARASRLHRESIVFDTLPYCHATCRSAASSVRTGCESPRLYGSSVN